MIAVPAALLAAMVAVLADRARASCRQAATAAARAMNAKRSGVGFV